MYFYSLGSNPMFLMLLDWFFSALHATTVLIHPLVIAGWWVSFTNCLISCNQTSIRLSYCFCKFCRCGLTTTAFNMLPVGCLDGGRALQVKKIHKLYGMQPNNLLDHIHVLCLSRNIWGFSHLVSLSAHKYDVLLPISFVHFAIY
jgi:Zn-dependent protease